MYDHRVVTLIVRSRRNYPLANFRAAVELEAVPLVDLVHVNLRTTRLPDMISFYEDVLGMRRGPRPAFSFGGAWLYVGDKPCVHLVEVDASNGPSPSDAPSLEHFALSATDLAGTLARLEGMRIPYRVGRVEDFHLVQVHVRDPEGNHLHLDFDARLTSD